MKQKELLMEAKGLNVKNAETLGYNDLQKAVSLAKKAKESEIAETKDAETVIEELKNKESESKNIDTISNDSKIDESKDNESETNEIKEGFVPFSSDKSEVDLDSSGVFALEDGRKFQFTEMAPEKFRYNNKLLTQEEWLKDKDAMEQLVFGDCSYIEQVF